MRFLRQLHRWAGLAIAVVVFAVAASGTLLLLRDPYYRLIYPSLANPVTRTPIATHAAVVSAIETRWTADGLRLIRFPRPGTNAFLLWFDDGSEALVDPATGRLIARWHWSTDVAAFLFELHADLLGDSLGATINGIIAAIVPFMGVTGLVLWWPRRRGGFPLRAVVPSTLGPDEALRSHAATGVLAVLPIVFFVTTGAAIVFYDDATALVGGWLDAPAAEQPDARVRPRDAPRRSWAEILATVDRTLALGETVFLSPATTEDARLVIRKRMPGEWHTNGRSYVVIDPYTATVVQAIDARKQGLGTRMMHAVYPLHTARVGGAGMVALAGQAGVALSWLAAGGVWSYASRRLSLAAPTSSTRRTPASHYRSTGS